MLYRRLCCAALAALCLCSAVRPLFAGDAAGTGGDEPKLDLRYRWIFFLGNLLPDENIDNLIKVCERGQKCGYNGLLVADSKFTMWDKLEGTHYNANVKRLREACARLKMDFIPSVAPVSNDILARDPNLAEGLPVTDCPFVVKDGRLAPAPELAVDIKNAGLEDWNQNGPIGWNFVDAPGKLCVKDTEVKAEGAASLRMQDIKANSDNGMGRICHALKVRP